MNAPVISLDNECKKKIVTTGDDEDIFKDNKTARTNKIGCRNNSRKSCAIKKNSEIINKSNDNLNERENIVTNSNTGTHMSIKSTTSTNISAQVTPVINTDRVNRNNKRGKEKLESVTPKKKKNTKDIINEYDNYCYECCNQGNLICCDKCTRSFHYYCLSEKDVPKANEGYWFCPICKITTVEIPPRRGKRKIRTFSTYKKENVAKAKVKQRSEGSKYNGKINVGAKYQVPFVTTFFLNDYARKYEESQRSELVYSPYVLEKVKEEMTDEGRFDLVIKDDLELAAIINEMASLWDCKFGYHPFTTEYAFKILHRVNYNPVKAIDLLRSGNFNFLEICDPPVRKYENKWRPGDKRGQISDSPYPSIDVINSYIEQLKRSIHEKNKQKILSQEERLMEQGNKELKRGISRIQ